MKNIISLLVFLVGTITSPLSAQTTLLNEIFDRYQDAEGVTSIKIAKPMFGMLDKLDIKDSGLDQVKPLLSKIEGLKILIIEKPDTSMDGKSSLSTLNNYKILQSEIAQALKASKYEELMSVNRQDSKIRILTTNVDSQVMNNLLLSITSDGDQILMMLDGKISIDDVNKLVNTSSEQKPGVTIQHDNDGVEIRKVSAFDGVTVSDGIKVNFTQGSPQIVRVETEKDKLKYVSTAVIGGMLKISLKEPKGNLTFKNITVDVVSPKLQSVFLNSGSSFNALNKIQSSNFNVNSASGSTFNATLEIKEVLTAETNSGADVTIDVLTNKIFLQSTSGSISKLSGKANEGVFDVSSAGNCNAKNLILKKAKAEVSSAGSLMVNVIDDLTANVSSSGSIKYTGNPKNINHNNQNTSGGKISKF